MGEPREPIGVIGTGYVGLVTAAGFAELGSDVYCVDIDEHKIAALAARRGADLRAGARRGARRAPRAPALLDARSMTRIANARLLFVSVGTPPTYSGDADLSAVLAVAESMPASSRARARDEVDRPLRHRSLDLAAARRAGQGRASPTSPARSSSRRAPRSPTSARPTASSSATTARLGRRRGVRALRAARSADRAHRRRQRRDDQARRQRLPRDEDLLHQRDRQRLRGDRRKRARGRARRRPRRADRAEVPRGRDRLRRLVLHQGRQRAEAARGELGLPLPAARLGDRGQRAAEAPRRRPSSHATSATSPGGASRCSASRSSRTPTTCAARPRWCSQRAWRRRARTFAPTTRSRPTRPVA